jgi:AcrR family transcriptional regulator
VARKLVSEGGLQALTIGALEQRLAFSRGVITYHFQNKDEIVEAVLESAIREIDAGTLASAQAGTTMEEKLRAIIHTTVRGFLDHVEAVRILISFWGRISSDRDVAAMNARLHATYRKRFASLVTQGQESGAFSAVSAKDMGAIAVGIVLGIALQVYFDPGSIDAEAVAEEATKMMLARLSAAQQGRSKARRAG